MIVSRFFIEQNLPEHEIPSLLMEYPGWHLQKYPLSMSTQTCWQTESLLQPPAIEMRGHLLF